MTQNSAKNWLLKGCLLMGQLYFLQYIGRKKFKEKNILCKNLPDLFSNQAVKGLVSQA
jgi:hypothetical protein